VPTLVFMFVSAAVSFPRIITTVHDSLGLLLERLRTAPDLTEAALAVVRIGGLLLPAAAISLSLFRGGRMALRGLVGWSRGSLRRRAVVVAVLTVLATALTAAWWPDGDYRPIRRDERGTLGEAVRAIPEYAVGGPGTTLLLHCRTVHGSLENRSSRARPLLLPVYSSADSFAYTPSPIVSPRMGDIVRGRAARQASFDTRPCELPPDFRAGYRPPWLAQQDEDQRTRAVAM